MRCTCLSNQEHIKSAKRELRELDMPMHCTNATCIGIYFTFQRCMCPCMHNLSVGPSWLGPCIFTVSKGMKYNMQAKTMIT